MNTRAFATCSILAATLALIPACEREAPAPTNSGATGMQDNDDHDHGPGEDHSHSTMAGHGGPVIPLGTSTIGPFTVIATRDQGEIIAGEDAPVDLTITPGAGTTATVAAVRFWIGTQDAAGSVKARAEVENPAEPNRWHTHGEVPSPLPANSMLWVEIEDGAGELHTGSFDLHMGG